MKGEFQKDGYIYSVIACTFCLLYTYFYGEKKTWKQAFCTAEDIGIEWLIYLSSLTFLILNKKNWTIAICLNSVDNKREKKERDRVRWSHPLTVILGECKLDAVLGNEAGKGTVRFWMKKNCGPHPSGKAGFGGQHSGYFWVLLRVQTGPNCVASGVGRKDRGDARNGSWRKSLLARQFCLDRLVFVQSMALRWSLILGDQDFFG